MYGYDVLLSIIVLCVTLCKTIYSVGVFIESAVLYSFLLLMNHMLILFVFTSSFFNKTVFVKYNVSEEINPFSIPYYS